MGSHIIGTGIALPKRKMTNVELSRMLGVTPAQIEKRTGIQCRYWVGEGETTSTLAIEASKAALEAADLSPQQIDLILVSTTSPDMFFPSTACLVQKGLSTRAIPAFDLNASCSGFLYALSVGEQFLRNQSARNVLIVSAEVKSPFIDLQDRSTAFLFGDGAGAVVLSGGGDPTRGIRSIRIHADGSRHRLIHLPGGSSRSPTSRQSLDDGSHTIKMEGKALFRMAVKKMGGALAALSSEHHLSLAEIDFFIFHQANLRILEVILNKTGIPLEKSHITIPYFGNTSSSSLPIALDQALREKKIGQGDCVALCSFGGGLTWAAALIDW